MKNLNLGTRVEMFSICTSIEFDLKRFILDACSDLEFTTEMREKAADRKKGTLSDEEILDQLDLKDFIFIISKSPYKYGINNDKVSELNRFFDRIIPVRNRVMHTKPLELGDRALLIEVMQDIAEKLPWIGWQELQKTKQLLEQGKGQLLAQRYIGVKEYQPKVYHNLPFPEFDDTGFIGRKRDVKEITELLLNRKNQIISVVGNGGMGKTATVVKTLYDLLDLPDNPYEAILWITLKTRTLSGGEFVEIEDSIKDIASIYQYGERFAIADDAEGTQMDHILQFMKEFKVLLVLDNLETINTGEINTFIRSIPENSKVLITSRLGLGEFEIRQKLEGLEKKDAIVYFRELSKYYGLTLHERDDAAIYNIINKSLYNNPLSIKWFISGVFSGTDEKKMLAHKDQLIEFCISNVFEKLSSLSKKILQLFLLESQKMTYGVIDFYTDAAEVDLRNSVNELLTTYMIHASSGEYIMNDMSKEYIAAHYPPENDFVKHVYARRKELKLIIQGIKVYGEQAPFNPNTVSSNLSDRDKQLAAYYLHNALNAGREKDWDNSKKWVDKAESIEPDFFEVYKVKAFLEAEKGELYGAINNYHISLVKAKEDRERAIVCYLFSVFYTVKMQDMDSALQYIDKADELLPGTNEILLEKVRVYTFIGKFDEAEALWHKAKENDKSPNLRTLNIVANRYLDLKRRQITVLQNRDYEKKYALIAEGIKELDSVGHIDHKTAITLLKATYDLSFLFFYPDAMELIADTLEKYEYAIGSIDRAKKKKVLDNIEKHKGEIREDIYSRIYGVLSSYKIESEEIESENEGIITKLSDTYGFISNAHYSIKKALYFSRVNAEQGIRMGDKVSFELYETPKGTAARKVKKID